VNPISARSSNAPAADISGRKGPTMSEPPDDSYPDTWRPREAVDRDNTLNPTEAELWLASPSPAEFQAVMMRVKGLR
jgi:hypothetical protein